MHCPFFPLDVKGLAETEREAFFWFRGCLFSSRESNGLRVRASSGHLQAKSLSQQEGGASVWATNQARKRNPVLNFLVRIFSGGVPREGVGAKKLGMSLETRETKLFFCGISRDFAGISRRCPKKFENRVHAKGVVLCEEACLPSKHLLSAFYNTPPSKNPCPY